MSIENMLSKEDLSLQVEQYINHRLRGKPYDPELAGCVVQIVSGSNPFRIRDETNYIDVADPSVINNKLKAANKNVNWHTMRGALICLRKWGFSSTYDAANDKLKFDIVIHDVDCIQATASESPIIPETIGLLDANHLKNKFNRLKKFHIAEELNESHPIETALEEIERERVNASEMKRFADHRQRRPQAIDPSLESKNNDYFWTYEMPNRQNQGDGQNFSATEPLHEAQGSIQEFKHHYTTLPENKETFSLSEKFPSVINPFKSNTPDEDDFNEYLEELEGGELGSKKPISKNQIEIEEVVVEQTIERDPFVPGKRKMIDVLNKRKEVIIDPLGSGTKRVFKGPMIDNASEQQKFIQARGSRSATKEVYENDLLNLLDAPEVHEPKRRSTPVREQTLKPSLKKEKVAPVPNLNDFVDISSNQPYSQILRVDKPKPRQEQEVSRARNTRVTVQQQNPNHYIFKTTETDEIAEIPSQEFTRSFKLIKYASGKNSEPKQVTFATDKFEQIRNPRAGGSIHQISRPMTIETSSPSPNKSRSRVQNLTPSKIVENPLDKSMSVDINEFKLIQWKPATSSKISYKK